MTSLQNVPVSGTTANGKHFTGKFTVTQFVTRRGSNYAVGTVTGQAGRRHITRSNVAIPVKVGNTGSNQAMTAAACPILHLELGPLNLNLLGLKVHLDKVVLDITAQSGPGNLLGNLLCSVSNLLNGTGLTGPLTGQQVSGLLNVVQQLLNVPSLLTF